MRNVKEMSMAELMEERSNIPAQLETEGADLDALEARAKEINAEIELRNAQTEQRKKILAQVTGGEGNIVRTFSDNTENRTFGVDSIEYRNAWLKTIMGRELTADEQRAYASTDSHTAIPTLVADNFFEKMKKLAPMLSRITLLRATGNIKFDVEGTRNTASKHTENSQIDVSADTILSVTLSQYEFFKIIAISEVALSQSIDGFENWLIEMLAGDIARAIENYILNDDTNGMTKGTFTTGTNQILNTSTTGYTYKNICDLIALLPAAYDSVAEFLVNKKTLWSDIKSIVDDQKRPIFDPEKNTLCGYPVVVDDYIASSNKGLYLGKWTDIVGNLSQDINVITYPDYDYGQKKYRGGAFFDSKVAKTDGIVRLVCTV